ncbi:MAG TPA: chromate resistance protein ChrB domain-containing protein [Gemmatimonadaceae bacterium]|nr:chromate resistance protein ChrB domain-containing protein [Gemmatimonadaceae bacterium]
MYWIGERDAGVRRRVHDGELRIDKFDAESTHVGAARTFEVLLDAFALRNDVGLSAIAGIVHDI